MASINDFSVLKKKCEKYFTLLEKQISIGNKEYTNVQKQRFGFYLYILEKLTNNNDIIDIVDDITDTDFNKELLNVDVVDEGVDAIHIHESDEENIISLYNFKYRNKFNKDKLQSINESFLSTKFVNALITENLDGLGGIIKEKAAQIIKRFNSNDEWKFRLFIVSNDSISLSENDNTLARLKELYELEIIAIGLEQIKEFMTIRPKAINSKIVVDKDAIMSYSESTISSSKSYIVRLQLSELLRITCNKDNLRNDNSIEQLGELSKIDLEYGVLFDNVRGFVRKSKYNQNIPLSLKAEPNRFFMYNNGITITAKDIHVTPINAGKKVKLEIIDFQVLNGGQTLRTLHEFNKDDDDNINKYLAEGEVLIRIFKTSEDMDLINKIAEYTNSQNPISLVDLKSLSSEQIALEQYLDEHGIIYARKSGDTGLSDMKDYTHKISMERYGQILYSINGSPEKSSNQKRNIFGKYYSDIFGPDRLEIEKAPHNIKRYFEIKNKYKELKLKYKASEQKVFYILYLDGKVDKSIESIIHFFEGVLNDYSQDDKSDDTDARRLIRSTFKSFLDERVKQVCSSQVIEPICVN